MVSHHSNDDDVSDFDSINKPSYDELHDVFIDLYDECLKLSKLNDKQKKIISSLESKSNDIQEELDKINLKADIHTSSSTCNKCTSLETNIVD